MPEPVHLHPTAPLAPRVLAPGDPGRALRLAQELLSEPKMFNHNRGLWGYTGTAQDGGPLTIQSTGMGGPSAAIVVTELAALGATQIVRIGTCGALSPSLRLGGLIVVDEALAADGASRALGASDRIAASPRLVEALVSAGGGRPSATVVTSDLFYDTPAEQEEAWAAAGAAAVEMETAPLFAVAARHGFEAGSLLLVTDIVLPERQRIDSDELHAGEIRLGRVATSALASLGA